MNVNFGRSANQARFANGASTREFLAELSGFHERRRTAFSGTPMLNGHPINLHKLYLTVCALGGCRKVTEKNRWQQVCIDSGFLAAAEGLDGEAARRGETSLAPSNCANAAYACKLTYMRWLEAFERVHLFGQPDEISFSAGGPFSASFAYLDDAFDNPYTSSATRSRRSVTPAGLTSVVSATDVANGQVATGFQQVLDPAARREGGLPETRAASEFERLTLSLLSGLPNEVDLAFNTLTILAASWHRTDSHSSAASAPFGADDVDTERRRPSPSGDAHSHTEIDLRRMPYLVDLLLAHIGFFSPDADSLFPLYSAWQHSTRRNYFRFWWHATAPVASRHARKFLFPRCFAHESDADAEHESCNAEQDDALCIFGEVQVAERSAEAARVYQAAIVLHAASADSHRADLLLSRDAVLRFILVAAASGLAPLRRLVLDILVSLCTSTRAVHAFLKEPARVTSVPDVKRRALLGLIRSLLESSDRQDVLTGLELLAALAHGLQRPPPPVNPNPNAANKGVKHDAHVERATAFIRLAVAHVDLLAPCHHYLLVADAALVVSSLEALYALAATRLRTFADHVATQRPQLLGLLVSFVSLDARALGNVALSGVHVFRESVAVTGRQARRDHRPQHPAQVNAVASHTAALPPAARTAAAIRPAPLFPAPHKADVPRRPDSPPRPAASALPAPAPNGLLSQQGRAAAFQWILLRCELNESAVPPASAKSSRAAAALAADVTSDGDLYADYLRFVSNAPARPSNVSVTCPSCAAQVPASTTVCACGAALAVKGEKQALSLDELKLIVKQVYPQIREAPAGGFYGLKLKPYLHSAAKSRPLLSSAPVNVINGSTTLPQISPVPTANIVAVNGLGDRTSIQNAAPVQKNSSESGHESDDAKPPKRPSRSSNSSLQPGVKRKRGRPRKDRSELSTGNLRRSALRNSMRRPPLSNQAQANGAATAVSTGQPSCNEPSACERSSMVMQVSQPAHFQPPALPLANGYDLISAKDGVQLTEAPFVFTAPVTVRHDPICSPANVCAPSPSVTREVIIERMKNKLERQRTERECGTVVGAPEMLINGDATRMNGCAEVDSVRRNDLPCENGITTECTVDTVWSTCNGGSKQDCSPLSSALHESETQLKFNCVALTDAPIVTLNGFHAPQTSANPITANAVENDKHVGSDAAVQQTFTSLMDSASVEPVVAQAQLNGPFSNELACSTNGFLAGLNGLDEQVNDTSTLAQQLQYACKWQAPGDYCMCSYGTLRELCAHAYAAHCEARTSACCWTGCAENSLVRSGYSLFMHLEEHHCREADFAATGARASSSGSHRPPVTYPPNAALLAIRKLTPRPPFVELADPAEGVLTKHIRLTAALVLHSLCDVSPVARDALRGHVSTLAQVAFADRDASSIVARILQRLVKHEIAVPVPSAAYFLDGRPSTDADLLQQTASDSS